MIILTAKMAKLQLATMAAAGGAESEEYYYLMPFSWFLPGITGPDYTQSIPDCVDKIEWFKKLTRDPTELHKHVNIMIELFIIDNGAKFGQRALMWAQTIKSSVYYKNLLVDILNGSIKDTLHKQSAPAALFKRKTIPKSIKGLLWDKYHKTARYGPCYCCGRQIENTAFEAGHVKAVALGGSNDLSNLRPICSVCNKSMGVQDLYQFKSQAQTIP